MWLKVKAVLTGVGCFFIMMMGVIPGFLNFDPARYVIFTIFLGLMSISTVVFGDILLGWKINSTDAVNLLEPNGLGEVTVDLNLIGGGRRILRGKKRDHGKIEFVFNNLEASVFDDGSNTIRFPNGNSGVVAHETYDKNVNFYKLHFLNEASKDLGADDIKDMHRRIIEKREEGDVVE